MSEWFLDDHTPPRGLGLVRQPGLAEVFDNGAKEPISDRHIK